MAAPSPPAREHWLCPINQRVHHAVATKELEYTVQHLYHANDLVHVFHVVPDIHAIRGLMKLDPNDEKAAEKFFKEHLEPILASAGANYVYEVAHASDIAVNTPRSIGEIIDIRATDIPASAVILGRRRKEGLLPSPDQMILGSVMSYLVKHCSRPVCVLPQDMAP